MHFRFQVLALVLTWVVAANALAIPSIDLTQDGTDIHTPSHDIQVGSTTVITKTFIETYPNTRVYNKADRNFYITSARDSIPQVTKYDFSTATYSQARKVRKPISMRLEHANVTGSGSIGVDTSISFSLRTKPHMHVEIAPALGPLTLRYAITKERYITLSNSITVLASCDSTNGHSVQLFLVVATTFVENIKTQTFTWNNHTGKFVASKVWYTSTYVDPKGNLECTGDIPGDILDDCT